MARKRFKSLDEKYMGPEPDFRETPPPSEKGERQVVLSKALHWYSYFSDKKKDTKKVLEYCEKTLKFSKKEMQAMRKVPDWKIYMRCNGFVRLQERGWNYTQEQINEKHEYLKEILELGKKILKEDKDIKKSKPKGPVLSPIERTKRKMNYTIGKDWEEMVIEKWMDGIYDPKKVKFPVYNLFQFHDLKGPAINMFREVVNEEYQLISDAYFKKEEQAVEAYSHIKKGDKRKMLNLMEKVFEDLDSLQAAAKAKRATRKPVTKAADKQVLKLNYCKEDANAKLASINPIRIPSSKKLYVYNIKQRRLAEYSSDSVSGFEVRGSTVYNWDEETSRIATLRKPEEMLPKILKGTEKQINNLWNSLTTKITIPTGRINKDCILLKVE